MAEVPELNSGIRVTPCCHTELPQYAIRSITDGIFAHVKGGERKREEGRSVDGKVLNKVFGIFRI